MIEIKKHALDSDMSEAGLNRRMKRLGNLRRLAQSLKTATPVPTPPSAVRESPAPISPPDPAQYRTD